MAIIKLAAIVLLLSMKLTNARDISGEINAAGYIVHGGSYMSFNEDGIIIGSEGEKPSGIPMVSGLELKDPRLFHALPIKDSQMLPDTLNLIETLSIYGIQADEIQYNSDLEADIIIKNLEIKLGDNSEIDGKIAELNVILSEFQDLNGTLYLNTYDESDTSPMYRFEKE